MNPEPRDLNLFHCQECFDFDSVSNSVKVEYLSAKIITMKKNYSCCAIAVTLRVIFVTIKKNLV